ncbi:hypothetical protein DXX93_20430 [Thalassotalea euphylliae]|uniref:Uncharacterized protein n=1 Tax=Thalassotalea euphylliae TaxID=1655234 RepID=A0A3E0TWA0_9GAMM|nr:hypothetical protein [Thalassotalea euphylliae]REL28700.1 hypothetical protein DXX93_20430 [Thalassotalea euphylliae]
MLSLVVTSVATSANAATSLAEQLMACRGEVDSLKRLVCYDGLAAASKQKTTSHTTLPAASTVAPVANTTSSVVTTSAPKAITVNAQDIFGQEAKFKSNQVDEVRFVIKSASLTHRKKWRFVFENGQKWEQKDTDRFGKFVAGEEVIIKRGVMNAFYLKKPSANRTIRVKRIK